MTVLKSNDLSQSMIFAKTYMNVLNLEMNDHIKAVKPEHFEPSRDMQVTYEDQCSSLAYCHRIITGWVEGGNLSEPEYIIARLCALISLDIMTDVMVTD